jgi:hypothetical protein
MIVNSGSMGQWNHWNQMEIRNRNLPVVSYTTKANQIPTPFRDAIPSIHPTEIKKYLAKQTSHKKHLDVEQKKPFKKTHFFQRLNMNRPPGFCASFLRISSFSFSIRSASSCCFFNCCVSNISLSQKNGGVLRLGNASLCLPYS